jgi:hypothetical protein
LSGPGLENPVAEEPTQFTIQVESNQNDAAEIKVVIEGPDGNQDLQLEENSKNSFLVRYTPQRVGRYVVSGKVNDIHDISESSVVVHVTQAEVDPRQTVVTCQTEDDNVYSHKPVYFLVETKSKHGRRVYHESTKVNLQEMEEQGKCAMMILLAWDERLG